ncbi:MAG: hypothetical protein KJ787_13965 [Gammaproteobacteria bacterium]|nr:hypothetical protein [Gammaproteobacteria bacterium]MBU1647433.1 hypothetical protein [Gammaproteobacteria bacterium]MBU1973225.1 hypothetical protein [Gammaproteobacteria bacterium]
MAADIPTTEPSALRSGDTWKWTKTLADYPASVWTLTYRFKNSSAGFEVVATASGDDYSVTVAAATTSGYASGTYSWQAQVSAAGEKFTVDTGTLVVDPNLFTGTASAAQDVRSHARKTLAAIESWIESRNPGVAEYEIAGRRMKYIPISDLLKMRQHYKAEVAAEDAREAIANGLGTGRKIQFRI